MFISKMEEMGIIQKEGVGRNTRYIKTASFPSFN
nr:MAG TPA: dissimilatory sulfite reductase D [Caudoviricetes sp.]